ncbi:hypothetical protein F7734_04645 [Scytonema sp. UIC 10036]|nr:hypothetical protein [Scytonema sp. UIC 10036]
MITKYKTYCICPQVRSRSASRKSAYRMTAQAAQACLSQSLSLAMTLKYLLLLPYLAAYRSSTYALK